MRLTTDDAIHRYSGRWIDLRGTQLPFFLRYVTWGCLVAVFVPEWGLLVALPGVGLMDAALWAGVMAVLVTMLVMREVDGDRTLRGLAGIARCEAATWRAAR